MKNFIKKNTDNILLGCILLIAFFLRIYKLPSIPFTHDEFSAIFRTQFQSFGELIEKGVMVDGHPPLVQVFLYYWIKLFGISEIWIKLPFIISGVLSVFLAYKIAKEWFDKNSAIIITIFIAFLQYTVLYSQIARPYGSGLFFILLFTYFWNKLVFHQEHKRIFNFIGYAISGALCAYDHHFALLQIAIIGLSGFFFIKRNQIIRYFLANLVIVVLYLPNLSVFFAQLNLKGIEGWLDKPDYDFILNYISYSFNFSWILGIVSGVILLTGIFLKPSISNSRNSLKWMSLAWFIIPFLIGFIYSKYVNAVLQYSVLIFAFPFLLFGIFGWIRSNSLKFRIITASLLSIVCIYSLVCERKHYQIFYESPYEKIVANAQIESNSLGKENCLTVFSLSLNDPNGTPFKAFQYYCKKLPYNSNYIATDLPSDFKNLQQNLENFKGNFVSYGFLSGSYPEIYPLIQRYFPYVYKTIHLAAGDIVVFSKNKTEDNQLISVSDNSFEEKTPNWDEPNKAFLIDSIASEGKFSYTFDSLSEWGPSFTDTLFNLTTGLNYIDISVDVMPLGNFTSAQLVSSIDQDSISIIWRSSQFSNFNMQPGKWTTVTLSLKLPDIKFKDYNPTIKTYLWNSEKQHFLVDRFRVCVRKGNPILYWIVTKEVKS